MKFFVNLPKFYEKILSEFNKLKILHNNDRVCNDILFNNKEILIGGKPFFNKEWFTDGIRSIVDLLDANGHFLTFNNFKNKYGLAKTNFVQFYQVVDAIPKHLLRKLINRKVCGELLDLQLDPASFHRNSTLKLNLTNMKSKDFYWLLID